ncbi:DUF3597 domain-containing protein [Sphingomonas sp. DG1-23]|uniref:DUF3597 domain-containing protein n=1 Tax=Sphingomonas sp. DG1-23 TaxID=3068316 RepID=UPI003530DC9E
MNAQTQIQPCDPARGPAACPAFAPPPGATRHEGWTPDRQRRFLEALSEGHPVKDACAIVGLSRQSAYALRQSPRGQSFALGWDGAVLLARNALADTLFERAFAGNRDTVTAADGRITTRHRQDNRLGMAVLNRLDRMADAAKGPAIAAAARLVAQDFAQYLELIGRDAGPARAGMFLGARIEPAGEDALAPLRALARADRWLRTHTDIAEPLATRDLDPAARAGWSAAQWVRAEAAGLVALAPDKCESCQACQPDAEDEEEDERVWWDRWRDEWRTSFPPPADYAGAEDGAYGDPDYSRTLSAAERAAYEGEDESDLAARAAADARERDLFFGFAAEAPEAPAADEPAAPSDAPHEQSDAPSHTGAASRVDTRTRAASRRGRGVSPMSIFGSIKDAIFGHKAAAPAQSQAQAPAQTPAQTPAMPQIQQPAAQPAAAAGPVDVENVLMVFETERGSADLNWRTSIVDLMKLLGLDSSLDNRKALATELGYTGATDGSAEMNIWLHKAVMQQLEKSGGKIPASLKD